ACAMGISARCKIVSATLPTVRRTRVTESLRPVCVSDRERDGSAVRLKEGISRQSGTENCRTTDAGRQDKRQDQRRSGRLHQLLPRSGIPLTGVLSRGQFLKHLLRPPEPRPFPSPQISGHGRLLIEHLLRPLASFGIAALGGQQLRKVQVSLGQRRSDRYTPEQRLGLFFLSSERVRVGQQGGGALEIVVRLFANHPFQ